MSYSTRIKVFHVLAHALSLASIAATAVALGLSKYVTGTIYSYDDGGNWQVSSVSIGLFSTCVDGDFDTNESFLSNFVAQLYTLQTAVLFELLSRVLGGHFMTYRSSMEANHPKKTAWLIHTTNVLTFISGVITTALVAVMPSHLTSPTHGDFAYGVSSFIQMASLPTGTLGFVFYALARLYINKAAKKDNPTDTVPLLAGHQVALTVNGQTYMASIAPADKQPFVHNQPGMYQPNSQIINQPTNLVMEGQHVVHHPETFIGGYVVQPQVNQPMTQQYNQHYAVMMAPAQYNGQMYHGVN